MEKLYFIINALSPNATKTHKEILTFFSAHPNSPEVKFSKYKGHTTELTLISISEGAKTIVACGGDGTVNEVAQCLVNTKVTLGIIPIGSGNGLARHLAVPIKLNAALELLAQSNLKKMDVGKVNDRYFFCNVSVGFSAHVIHCYSQITQSGITAYAKAFWMAFFSFKYSSLQLHEKNQKLNSTPFELLISNTNQFGYDKTLTPKASLFDGKLDLVRIEKSNWLSLIVLIFFGFFKKFSPFIKINRKQIEEVKLYSKAGLKVQLDGEGFENPLHELEIKILPEALEVIC